MTQIGKSKDVRVDKETGYLLADSYTLSVYEDPTISAQIELRGNDGKVFAIAAIPWGQFSFVANWFTEASRKTN